MSNDMKQRMNTLFGIFRVTFQYGYIPMIIYLGLRKGADPGCPELSLGSLLWQ